MCKRWTGGALLAVWLGLAVVAHAQYLPSPVGAARMPEPLPTGSGDPGGGAPCPDLSPGPINPLAAPAGPPNCLDLPANHTNAFQCEEYVGDGCHFYANIGAMALQRNKLGAGDIAVLDPTPGGGALPPGTPVAVFVGQQSTVTGVAADGTLPLPPGSFPRGPTIGRATLVPLGQPDVQRFRDPTPPMSWGLRGTFGFIAGDNAVEATIWGIFQNGTSNLTTYPGQIDTLFYNQPVGFFPGFQSDTLLTTQNTALFNAELNCRRWNIGIGGLEFIAGVRYLQIRDALSITTVGSDAFAQFTTSEYAVTAYNRLAAGQMGFEYNMWLLSWLSLGVTGKAAVGANFISTDVSLTRPPDQYIGFNTPHHAISLGQIYELGGFFDIHLLDRLRVRGGYMTLWVVDVATSVDQVDFNLRGDAPRGYNFQQAGDYTRLQPHGLNNNSGSMFFHGPMLEAQLLF